MALPVSPCLKVSFWSGQNITWRLRGRGLLPAHFIRSDFFGNSSNKKFLKKIMKMNCVADIFAECRLTDWLLNILTPYLFFCVKKGKNRMKDDRTRKKSNYDVLPRFLNQGPSTTGLHFLLCGIRRDFKVAVADLWVSKVSNYTSTNIEYRKHNYNMN